MAGWRCCHLLVAIYHIIVSTSASQLYDVTTVYRFDDLEYVFDPKCSQGEFLCGDGTCIGSNLRCDRETNCPDGSDEQNCPEIACSDNEFRCNNGKCISRICLCDGFSDCEDYEDERCYGGSYNDKMKEASVEIRVRTNALGLPVDTTMEPAAEFSDTETEIPSWPSESEDISWKAENWKMNSEHTLETAKLKYNLSWKHDNTYYDQSALTKPMDFQIGKQHEFVFIPINSYGYLIIKATVNSQYYIKMSPEGGTFYRCYSSLYYSDVSHELPGVPPNYQCEIISRFAVPVETELLNWVPGNVYKFRISVDGNYLTAQIFQNSQWQTLVSIHVGAYRSDYSYELATLSMKGIFLSIGSTEPYFELEGEEGRLKSLKFHPIFEKICLAVECSITPGSQSSLELYAQNSLGDEKFKIGVIDSRVLEPTIFGFSRHRFTVDIPQEFRDDSLNLVLSGKKSSDAQILVHRIFGCNIYDEDVTIFPKRYVREKSMLTAYTVTDRNFISLIPRTATDCVNGGWFDGISRSCDCSNGFAGERCEKGSPKNCLHGGSYDNETDSCLCRIGFVGELCEQGCGPNRFGNDCGGMCSRSLTACKNMILCRHGFDCDCAPGVKGDFCDMDCASGEYGAGCQQRCGNCKDSSCDPYTGVCRHGCLPSFYPPFCKTSYKHLVSAPDVTATSFSTITASVDLRPSNMAGDGEPRFFQIQYKLQNDTEWKEMEPQNIPEQSSESAAKNTLGNITNLVSGTTYKIRVVLIDKDGSSNHEEDLSSAFAKTQCIVPDDVNYNFRISNVQEHGFQVLWNLTPKEALWCFVIHFEVHVYEFPHWIIHKVRQEDPHILVVSDKLPGGTFYVKVRAIHDDGVMAFSPMLTVTTIMSKPGVVRNLGVESTGTTAIQLQWDEPWSTDVHTETYNVEYECSRLLGCPHDSCNSSKGNITVHTTSMLLEDLLPHAQYLITVTAVLAEAGSEMSILATTDQTVPMITPTASPQAVMGRTNTSFTVQWSRPKECVGLRSYLQGYHYELWFNRTVILFEGNTTATSVEFSQLTPQMEYELNVFLLTSAGWNSNVFLTITVTTMATVPGPVGNLTVYKCSRKVVALRWSPAEHVYGELESFKVSYSMVGGRQKQTKSKVITPQPCVAWPESFCHTITDLRPDTNYAITVQVKNSEVNEYGESSTVQVMTREGGVPGVPVNLRLAKRTHISLCVRWELPRMFNGMLRSFVLNIEEMDSYNSSECCKYFPLQEQSVTAELKSYSFEFTDLNPASKYTISVSGKTTSLGPSVSLSATTRPAVTILPQPPEVTTSFEHGGTIPVSLHPAVAYDDLLRVYLLLVVPRGQKVATPHTGVFDSDLAEQLDEAVGSAFYVTAEILPEELPDSNQFFVGTGKQSTDGALYRTEDPILDSGEYSVGLAIVLEYDGVYSIGYVQSPVFTVV